MAMKTWCNSCSFYFENSSDNHVHSKAREHVKNDNHCHEPDVYMQSISPEDL